MYLDMFILACRQFNTRHTAENLSAKLHGILDDFNIDTKTWIFVSDSAKNMEKRNIYFFIYCNFFISFTLVGRIINEQGKGIQGSDDVEDDELEQLTEEEIDELILALDSFDEVSSLCTKYESFIFCT